MFWHLDKFSTLALAEKAKGPHSIARQALGQNWLLTIAEAGWRPNGSEHIAEIGPLQLDLAIQYVAQYMEAVMDPGMETRVHRHPGPDAWVHRRRRDLFVDPGRQTSWKARSERCCAGRPTHEPLCNRQSAAALARPGSA
jgi:hypothetical protein